MLILISGVNRTRLQSCISQRFSQHPGCSVMLCQVQRDLRGRTFGGCTHRDKKKKALYALIQLYTVYICHSFSFAITHFTQDLRHLKCSRGVHVGSDDGDASVALFGVAECERPLKVHLRGTGSD